jgi:hypothetical protein
MSEPRVRIRAGWRDAGKEGYLLAGPIRDRKGQHWMVVQWDVDEDPDMHKVERLEVSSVEWKAVKL